jgi:hypothetical protein
VINANLNTFSLNIELFGWSTGSLIFIALILFSNRMRKNDWLMLAIMGAVVGLYSFYYFSGGPDFGARYWYLMFVPLVALTARSIQSFEAVFEFENGGATAGPTLVLVAVMALCLLSLVNYFPWRALDKYQHYRGMRPDIRYLAEEYSFGKSLVLIRSDAANDYASAATYNPIDLHADVPVYGWDRDSDTSVQLLQAYADRPVWIIKGPSLTGRGYEVMKGPLSVNELIAKSNLARSPLP